MVHRFAPGRRHPGEHADERLSALRIQPGRRLVQEDCARVGDQADANRDTPPFAARDAADCAVHVLAYEGVPEWNQILEKSQLQSKAPIWPL